MGVQLHAQTVVNSPYLQAVEDVFRVISKRISNVLLQPYYSFRFTKHYYKQKNAIDTIFSFTDEVIRKKRNQLKDLPEGFSLDSDEALTKRRPFLDLLIGLSAKDKGKAFNDIELREEVLTIIIAGTDTSAVGIGYTLTMLGAYTHIQDKVYQEIMENLGDRPVTKDNLSKLVYLEAVIKESMRLYPPVPIVARKIEKEVLLQYLETAMGVQLHAQTVVNSPYLQAVEDVFRVISKRISNVLLQPYYSFRFTKHYYKQKNAIDTIFSFTDEVIRKKRNQLKDLPEGFSLDSDEALTKRRPFLDLLIGLSAKDKGKAFNYIELREEVLTIIIAGTDTSAVGIGYTLTMLGAYTHIQDKVYQEIMENLGDRPVTKDNLSKLVYLEAVIKESMRLYPPVPIVARKIEKEVLLQYLETAMGVQLHAQTVVNSPYLQAVEDVFRVISKRISNVLLQPYYSFRFTKHYYKQKNAIDTIFSFTDEVIRKKRNQLKDLPEGFSLDSDEALTKRRPFLDLLIGLSAKDKGKAFNDIELREEVLTIIIAGTDTSAVGIGYTLTMLGAYTHIQDKVYQEIMENLGDRPVTKDNLSKLVYLEAVIKESMRLYPPVPIVAHKIEKEVLLPSGRTLPAGCGAVINIFGLHRNEDLWGGDVEEFRPERFLTEGSRHPCAYMPFSHSCLGYQYAMMSIKTVATNVVRKFKVKAIESSRLSMEIMMRPTEGFQIELTKRE